MPQATFSPLCWPHQPCFPSCCCRQRWATQISSCLFPLLHLFPVHLQRAPHLLTYTLPAYPATTTCPPHPVYCSVLWNCLTLRQMCGFGLSAILPWCCFFRWDASSVAIPTDGDLSWYETDDTLACCHIPASCSPTYQWCRWLLPPFFPPLPIPPFSSSNLATKASAWRFIFLLPGLHNLWFVICWCTSVWVHRQITNHSSCNLNERSAMHNCKLLNKCDSVCKPFVSWLKGCNLFYNLTFSNPHKQQKTKYNLNN